MATTPAAIRDRAIAAIAALSPADDSSLRFRAYRNEGGADFEAWSDAHPTGCTRRFQVVHTGRTETPQVSNTDFEEHRVTLEVRVAYEQSHRWGNANALDRQDVMDRDAFQIDKAIGMLGRANFASPYPDACWLEGSPPEFRQGATRDLVVLEYTYLYQRAR